MSKEQIEKMACDMCTVIQNCNEPYKPIPSCRAYQCAKRAVEKGYRKQSEIAKEIISIIEHRAEQNKGRRKGVQSEFWIGVHQGREDAYKDIIEIIGHKFGAKMKGGAEE